MGTSHAVVYLFDKLTASAAADWYIYKFNPYEPPVRQAFNLYPLMLGQVCEHHWVAAVYCRNPVLNSVQEQEPSWQAGGRR